ncbi:MAG: 50S ribosomal protein L6 [Hyphomicrobiaceae bacterium]
MSRIGKKPVGIPKGVEARIDGQSVKVKGPKGELGITVVDEVEVSMADGSVTLKPRNESKRSRAMWGMSRTLVQNMVDGVTNGYREALEIHGVGYRAQMKGPKELQLNLGFSHEVVFQIPDGLKIELPKPTEIVITGIDKQTVGYAAAKIRSYRPPEPYQGKGVRYQGEFILRKEGKKK